MHACPAMMDGYSSLPPNPPPVSVWMTRTFSGGETEQDRQRAVDVVGALHRSVERDPALLRNGDDAVGLDVELLLEPDAVLPLDDGVGLGEPAPQVPLGDLDRLEGQRGRRRIEHRGRGAIPDVHLRAMQRLGVLVREQQDRLGDVPDLAFGQARLVVLDERDDVAAGHVAVVGDGETVRVEVEASRKGSLRGGWSTGSSPRGASRESSGRRCTAPPRSFSKGLPCAGRCVRQPGRGRLCPRVFAASSPGGILCPSPR